MTNLEINKLNAKFSYEHSKNCINLIETALKQIDKSNPAKSLDEISEFLIKWQMHLEINMKELSGEIHCDKI